MTAYACSLRTEPTWRWVRPGTKDPGIPLNSSAIGILRQARQVIEHTWPKLAAHNPSPEFATSVEELTNLIGSGQIIDS